MAEQYWRAYANDPRLAAMQAAVAAAAAPQSVPAKRPRSDFGDMAGGAPQYSAGGAPQYQSGGAAQYPAGGAAQYPAGGGAQYSAGNAAQYSTGGAPQYSDYPSRDDDRGAGRLVVRDGNSLGASYDQYLRNGQMPSYGGGDNGGRQLAGGMPNRPPVDDPRMMGMGGGDSRSSGYGGGRQDMSLPPDASNTLFVEGLPSDCTRREVSHIFRPFVGFREVRLVTKESRHPGGDPLILCFVDFSSPNQAAVALDALQGYKFDEHDRESASLRLQFARFPGPRSGGGGPRGRR